MRNKNLILALITILILFVGCGNETKELPRIKGDSLSAVKINIRDNIDIKPDETLYIYNVYDNNVMFGVSEPNEGSFIMVNTTRYVGVYNENKGKIIARHNVKEKGEVSNMIFHNNKFYYSMLLAECGDRGFPWAVYSVQNDEEKKLLSSFGESFYFYGSPTFKINDGILTMLYESVDDEGYTYGINIIDDDDNIKNVFERKNTGDKLTETDYFYEDGKFILSTYNKQDEVGKFHIIDKNFKEKTIIKRKNAEYWAYLGGKIIYSFLGEEPNSWSIATVDIKSKKETITRVNKRLYFINPLEQNSFIAYDTHFNLLMFKITDDNIIESKVDTGEYYGESVWLTSSGDDVYLNYNMYEFEELGSAVYKVS